MTLLHDIPSHNHASHRVGLCCTRLHRVIFHQIFELPMQLQLHAKPTHVCSFLNAHVHGRANGHAHVHWRVNRDILHCIAIHSGQDRYGRSVQDMKGHEKKGRDRRERDRPALKSEGGIGWEKMEKTRQGRTGKIESFMTGDMPQCGCSPVLSHLTYISRGKTKKKNKHISNDQADLPVRLAGQQAHISNDRADLRVHKHHGTTAHDTSKSIWSWIVHVYMYLCSWMSPTSHVKVHHE